MTLMPTSYLRLLLLMTLCIAACLKTDGQTSAENRQTLVRLQDSLKRFGYTMYNIQSEPERLDANFSFVRTLVSALKTPYSYEFPFDSLDMVSILRTPDDRFRIFTWHIPLDDGSYLYYGTIQINTGDGSLKLFPLLDKTYQITDPEKSITSNNDWYGAQYYDIIPVGDAYLLLGWKGHNPRLTQKVIEVLHVDNAGATLGRPIFQSKETSQYTRMIYQFSRQASMYLAHDTEEDRIIADHLAPMDENNVEQFETYGPDMTHDAWKILGDKLVFESDILFQNQPSIHDEHFNDPTKPITHKKSGLQAEWPQ